MTNALETDGAVPSFELRHRMALSLEHGRVPVQEMADVLGISRNTVGNYLSGRTKPGKAVMRVWALRCGVPYSWMVTGEVPRDSPGGPASTIWLTVLPWSQAA